MIKTTIAIKASMLSPLYRTIWSIFCLRHQQKNTVKGPGKMLTSQIYLFHVLFCIILNKFVYACLIIESLKNSELYTTDRDKHCVAFQYTIS